MDEEEILKILPDERKKEMEGIRMDLSCSMNSAV